MNPDAEDDNPGLLIEGWRTTGRETDFPANWR